MYTILTDEIICQSILQPCILSFNKKNRPEILSGLILGKKLFLVVKHQQFFNDFFTIYRYVDQISFFRQISKVDSF